ncbi:MAG: DUF2249 domain-containing protein [Magnetospirillum sp. WYHS-4]
MTRFTVSDPVARVMAVRPAALEELRRRFPALGCFADPALAGEVTLGEAAHMAEVGPLSLVAFVNGEADGLGATQDEAETVPSWMGEAAAQDIPLDVRPQIAAGEDPRDRIVGLARAVPERGYLSILAPFDPLPLRRLLGGAGFSSHARREAPGRWRVVFHRDGGGMSPSHPVAPLDMAVLDLRRMEAPGPLVAILSRIDSGQGRGGPFEVLLARDPIFLYPELAERGWQAEALPASDGGVRLRLSKAEGA